MEFIKKMKKREFIEMGLKTFACLMAAFLAIILMEGMIYSIQLNALKTKSTMSYSVSTSTIAYCIEEGKDKYYVIYYNEGDDFEWSAAKETYKTKAECENLNVKEVIFGAPNAFQFSITPVHFVIMGVFVAIVAGYFVYRFIKLNKEYTAIETNFKENGVIELTNL